MLLVIVILADKSVKAGILIKGVQATAGGFGRGDGNMRCCDGKEMRMEIRPMGKPTGRLLLSTSAAGAAPRSTETVLVLGGSAAGVKESVQLVHGGGLASHDEVAAGRVGAAVGRWSGSPP